LGQNSEQKKALPSKKDKAATPMICIFLFLAGLLGRGNRFMTAGPVGVIYLLALPAVLTANTRKAQVCFKPSA
jgi:hypothetical protein